MDFATINFDDEKDALLNNMDWVKSIRIGVAKGQYFWAPYDSTEIGKKILNSFIEATQKTCLDILDKEMARLRKEYETFMEKRIND